MNLSDAFSNITCTMGEAQIILASLIANLRDSYPDLYASMSQEIADLHEHPEEPPVTRSSTSSSTATGSASKSPSDK